MQTLTVAAHTPPRHHVEVAGRFGDLAFRGGPPPLAHGSGVQSAKRTKCEVAMVQSLSAEGAGIEPSHTS